MTTTDNKGPENVKAKKSIRITKKFLTNWVNSELPKLGLSNIELKDIYAVNKNSHPAAGFVTKLVFVFDNGILPTPVYCYLSMKELQDHIDSGFVLHWKPHRFLSQTEITVIRNSKQ